MAVIPPSHGGGTGSSPVRGTGGTRKRSRRVTVPWSGPAPVHTGLLSPRAAVSRCDEFARGVESRWSAPRCCLRDDPTLGKAPIVQWPRTPLFPSGSTGSNPVGGTRTSSFRVTAAAAERLHHAPARDLGDQSLVAQLAELSPVKRAVAGSRPAEGARGPRVRSRRVERPGRTPPVRALDPSYPGQRPRCEACSCSSEARAPDCLSGCRRFDSDQGRVATVPIQFRWVTIPRFNAVYAPGRG